MQFKLNLIRTCRSKLEIRIANVNKQVGGSDGGVFVAAYYIALVSGQDLVTFVCEWEKNI